MEKGPRTEKILKIIGETGIPLVKAAKARIPGLGLTWACTALLPYPIELRGERDFGESWGNDAQATGSVAPFAARNYYRELSKKLIRAAAIIKKEFGGEASAYRVLCNSPVPEKPIAAAAGLGFIGRNTLLINPVYGSRCVLGVLVLPFELDASRQDLSVEKTEPGAMCGSCRLCVEACPSKAICEEGGLTRGLCLQDWAARPEPLPESFLGIWGRRIYGCEDCQNACPFNKPAYCPEAQGAADPSLGFSPRHKGFSPSMRGDIGTELPLSLFLEKSEGELRAFLKGTALGMSWISITALKRNAIIAAGNAGAFELTAMIQGYAASPITALGEAAAYALETFQRPSSPYDGRRIRRK